MSADDLNVDLREALTQRQVVWQESVYADQAMAVGMMGMSSPYYAAGMSSQMNASWQAQAGMGMGTGNPYAQAQAPPAASPQSQFDAYLGYLNQITPTGLEQTRASNPPAGSQPRWGARIRAWWGRLLASVRRLRAWWWAHVEAGGYARQVARVLERRARQAREGGL